MTGAVDRYYRNSGAVPFVGTVLMLVCGLVAAGVLPFVYALVDWYNPFLYVTFIGTGIFGFGLGVAVTFGAGVGKVRNKLFSTLVGLVISCIAMYLAWVWFVWIVTKFELLSFEPSVILAALQIMAVEGVWDIRGA